MQCIIIFLLIFSMANTLKVMLKLRFFFYLFEYGNCIFFGSGDFDP